MYNECMNELLSYQQQQQPNPGIDNRYAVCRFGFCERSVFRNVLPKSTKQNVTSLLALTMDEERHDLGVASTAPHQSTIE